MTQRRSITTALLVVGALTWVPARWGVMTTWDAEWLGLGYTSWNRLTLLPLAMLAAGAAAATRLAPRRSAAIGWAVVAAGFLLSALGVALEFVFGGGLQGGPRELAVAGWTAFLLGYAVIAAGSIVLAAGLARHDRTAAAAAALSAVLLLSWPLLLAVGQHGLAVGDQLLVAVPWLVLAVRLSRPATVPTTPTTPTTLGSAPAAPGRRRSRPPSASSAPR